MTHAIADNFNEAHIEARHIAGPREGWIIVAGSQVQDGQPLIVCVLLSDERPRLVKLMDTTSGPYYYGCPVAWLERVPVREGCGGNDAKWRAEVCRRAGVAVPSAVQGGLFVPAAGVSSDD